MATYIYKNGKFVCKKTGKPMIGVEDKKRFKRMLKEGRGPLITHDIPDYQSPVTGEWVSGRAQRREDLIKNDCYEIDPPTKPIRERQKAKRTKIEQKPDRELNEKLEAIINTRGLD